MADDFQVSTLNLIGFRVKQRIIERSNITSQIGTLVVLQKDELLAKMTCIEPAKRAQDGSITYSGKPCTIDEALQGLMGQLSNNDLALHELAHSYKEEKDHGTSA